MKQWKNLLKNIYEGMEDKGKFVYVSKRYHMNFQEMVGKEEVLKHIGMHWKNKGSNV